MIYPFPEGKHKAITSLIKGFALLDIIDMAELIFGDVGCFQIDTSSWLSFFYVALVLSAILTTSSYGLEQHREKYDCPWDYLSTIFSLLFNDMFFFILRVRTMHKHGNVYFGVIFVIKECLSFIFRILMNIICIRIWYNN